MSLVVRAPASTANLGPGFDCVAAALDLWNEVEIWGSDPLEGGREFVEVEGEGAEEVPRDAQHLSLRAFAVFADPERHTFRFTNRIPLERGLGSSAAAIAAGLVAGAAVAGERVDAARLLELALEFEGHADNLSAAINGGVCLTWRNGAGQRVARVAADLPLAPVVVVPDTRVDTAASRSRLPETIQHADAAEAASHAALLGAAIASSDAELLASALHDRLHEPYREADAPLLAELRRELPPGAAGVTLSGSGPSVVVWSDNSRVGAVAAALERRFPDARVLPLRVAAEGATAG